ncbi:MAG: carboxylate-amine ligase [Azospirillaceae bacterium]
MAQEEPSLTLGVEEEYLIVDPESRDLVREPPPALLDELTGILGSSVSPEFLQCQIEVGTPKCANVAEARAALGYLRRTVSQTVRRFNLAFIASSTHPFAPWSPQRTTSRSRYEKLLGEIGTPARRLLICAMHVHAGIENDNLRIDLMDQVRYFLPHLLALSTSSPFWQGAPTGMKSYRLSVFNELPRTAMPEAFETWGEYEKHLAVLVDTGVIEDGTKIWWDIRPSARFPTLEMRICDICTAIEDAMTIIALYACLLRMLWRLRTMNTTWRRYKSLLINENRWRAMRYGSDEGLIDFGRREMVPYADLLHEIMGLVAEDARVLGCEAEVARAPEILSRGTSAHRQLAIFEEARSAGADERQAFQAVVDWLIEETVAGCE